MADEKDISKVPNPISDNSKIVSKPDSILDRVKSGSIGLGVGVALGWLAKTAYDLGLADDFLKNCGLNRSNPATKKEKLNDD